MWFSSVQIFNLRMVWCRIHSAVGIFAATRSLSPFPDILSTNGESVQLIHLLAPHFKDDKYPTWSLLYSWLLLHNITLNEDRDRQRERELAPDCLCKIPPQYHTQSNANWSPAVLTISLGHTWDLQLTLCCQRVCQVATDATKKTRTSSLHGYHMLQKHADTIMSSSIILLPQVQPLLRTARSRPRETWHLATRHHRSTFCQPKISRTWRDLWQSLRSLLSPSPKEYKGFCIELFVHGNGVRQYFSN